MYLCHSENLMPKDTKSLGNNKAPACESRGFVLKKKKVRILTHLLVSTKKSGKPKLLSARTCPCP